MTNDTCSSLKKIKKNPTALDIRMPKYVNTPEEILKLSINAIEKE